MTTERYVLGERLGAGSVGEVFRARDEVLHRDVALKLLGADVKDAARQRFEQEGRIQASLCHSGVVPVHDLGQLSDGRPFISMQLVDGVSLATRLEAGELGRHERIDVFLKVCDAVAYAHQQGVVHRDLKPDNVLVGSHGEVFVTDWGLAREGRAPRTRLTRVGQIMGTPYYMSPEAALGRGREAGPTSDVYSLGAVLYTLLSGHPPFDTVDAYEVVQRVAKGEVVPIAQVAPELPSALRDVVTKAMALDPADRFQSASELADGIRRAARPEPKRRSFVTPALVAALGVSWAGLALSVLLNLLQALW